MNVVILYLKKCVLKDMVFAIIFKIKKYLINAKRKFINMAKHLILLGKLYIMNI